MAATPAHAQVQELLRFLTKDARLPLSEAMPKVHPLRKLSLETPEAIAKAQSADLKVIFPDEKILKQVVTAAKRASNPNKRATAKKVSRSQNRDGESAADTEAELALPVTNKTEEELRDVLIESNRAPVFLAFAVMLAKYTIPEQPLSSRLSIAQAVVSAGAQSKAKYIGITTSPTAEEDGWAQGQPKIRLMGRDVAVMRRHIPQPTSDGSLTAEVTQRSQTTHDAFWGIDLDALRKSNGPLIPGARDGKGGPPVHTAQSARQYLLKSMQAIGASSIPSTGKKRTAAEMVAEKAEAVAMVLKAIDIVCESWQDTLTTGELDRRAQSWYATVRPEVAQGQAGWGQRGTLRLSNILKLKRTL